MKTRSTRFGWLLATVVAAACVPATEDADPRGGVVVRLVPTAETKGQPFTSVDGWTITVERFAVRAYAQTERPSPDDGNPDDDFAYPYVGGAGSPRIVGAKEECELIISAVIPGPSESWVDLQPRFSGFEDFKDESFCGVDDDLRARFNSKAQSTDKRYESSFPDEFLNAPSLVLLGRAEKGGRTVRLDLALDVALYGREDAPRFPVTIVANQGALARSGVNASALFLALGKDARAIKFDSVAAADTNGDGVVTGSELAEQPDECPETSPESGDDDDDDYDPYPYPPSGDDDTTYEPKCGSLLTTINQLNAAYLFGLPPR